MVLKGNENDKKIPLLATNNVLVNKQVNYISDIFSPLPQEKPCPTSCYGFQLRLAFKSMSA